MILTRWPGFRLVSRGRNYVWEGKLQPTPLSPVYTIRIVYADWGSPKTSVVNPPLARREDAPIPHRYGDGSLCLYLPGEWSSQHYIAETIIPWSVLWLHHYEVWRITGKWLGGGVHLVRPPTAEPTHGHETLPHPVP